MKSLLAVLRREVFEHRLVFAAGGIAGILALAAPLLPATGAHSPAEVRESVAIVPALLFAIGVSILLGASVLARDLFERRSSFYFSRPLSAFSIWAGKMVGAAAISIGTFFLILLPSILSGADFREVRSLIDPGLPLLAVIPGAILVLVSSSHAAAVLLRSRSPLLLLDVAALVLLFSAGAALLRVFLSRFALGSIPVVMTLAASTAAIGLLAGGAAQVIVGRTDPRRGRLALSAGFWSVALIGALVCAGYATFILAAGPEDLSVQSTVSARQGSWLAVSGRAAGRGDFAPTFLLDTAKGTSLRAGEDLTFSRNGKRAVWTKLQSFRQRSPVDIITAALDRVKPEAVETRISASAWNPLVLSGDGTRIASLGQTISVFDLASGKLLGAARSEAPAWSYRGSFVTTDLVRVWRRLSPPRAEERATIEILEFDMSRKKLARTGSIRLAPTIWPLLSDRAGDRLLIRSENGSRVALYDGRTGALQATLIDHAFEEHPWTDFLSDGRIVLGHSRAGAAMLRLFARDGAVQGEVPLGPGALVLLGGEAAPGQLVVAVGPERMRSELTGKVLLVDLARGTVRPLAEKLFPIASFPRWFAGDPTEAPDPGSEATKLFHGPNGSLVRLDPLTGERRVILAGKG